jgi:acyl carrier protein
MVVDVIETESLQNKLIDFMCNELGVSDNSVTPEANIFEDGIVDSILIETFLVWIEDTFDITFDESHFFDERFGNISGIAEIIQELRIQP